jgi:SAM-dependent methyltransferase
MASMQCYHPQSVLDLGCGVGAYGSLMRRFIYPTPWITGVDIWEPYLKSEFCEVYDELICADIFDAVNGKLDLHFDTVLCMDVLEHFERPRARELSDWLLGQPRAYMSTPLFDYPQGAVDGNEYERHLSHYTMDELVKWGWRPLAKARQEADLWIGAFTNG